MWREGADNPISLSPKAVEKILGEASDCLVYLREELAMDLTTEQRDSYPEKLIFIENLCLQPALFECL